jgi:hypothetical protein
LPAIFFSFLFSGRLDGHGAIVNNAYYNVYIIIIIIIATNGGHVLADHVYIIVVYSAIRHINKAYLHARRRQSNDDVAGESVGPQTNGWRTWTDGK